MAFQKTRMSLNTGSNSAADAEEEGPAEYQLIRVMKSDGTIITVKKKPTKGKDSGKRHVQHSELANSESKYKIVTVRMPDGSRGTVRREKSTSDIKGVAAPESPFGKFSVEGHPEEKETDESPEQHDTANAKDLRVHDPQVKKHRPARLQLAPNQDDINASMIYLPELVDGDELLSDSETSDSEDDEESDFNERIEDLEALQEDNGQGLRHHIATAAIEALAGGISQTNSGPEPKPKVELDEKEADLRDGQAPIRRRWADFSFYFMASLSIILPILFLILTAFIMAMDGKPASSKWGMIIDPIKISVTVWPIVFAAVTAQGFKTWATYRVERGVKLMELEQLVGSNSFGSVMKQQFLLRRIDTLTLFIFFIWALSPIGSQALLRVYTLERGFVSDSVPALYVPLLGTNRLLSPGAETRFPDATALSEHWQALCVFFLGEFLPEGGKVQEDPATNEQDLYHHPFPRKLNTRTASSIERQAGRSIVSSYGIAVALSPPVIPFLDKSNGGKTTHEAEGAHIPPPFENVTFPVTSSYFNITCDKWQTTNRSTLNETMYFTLSETMGLNFSASANAISGIDQMRFATLLNGSAHLNGTDWNHPTTPEPDWKYATIDCTLKQIFYKSTVICWIDSGSHSTSQSFSCSMDWLTILPDNEVRPEWHTNLTDFSGEFVFGANPFPILHPYTPIEHWAISNDDIDASHSLTNESATDLGPLNTDPHEFAESFAVALNGFITVAHCPECTAVTRLSSVRPDISSPPGVNSTSTTPDHHGPSTGTRVLSPASAALYVTPTNSDGLAKRIYSPPGLIFSLSWPWVWTLLVCVLILLIVGIASVIIESFLIAPDVLGYASTLVRNSRYLNLPRPTTRATKAATPEKVPGNIPLSPMSMSGSQRARIIGGVEVMMQDVKPNRDVGKIALGLKHDRAERLKRGRYYR